MNSDFIYNELESWIFHDFNYAALNFDLARKKTAEGEEGGEKVEENQQDNDSDALCPLLFFCQLIVSQKRRKKKEEEEDEEKKDEEKRIGAREESEALTFTALIRKTVEKKY